MRSRFRFGWIGLGVWLAVVGGLAYGSEAAAASESTGARPAFSPDGLFIVTADGGGAAALRDGRTGAIVRNFADGTIGKICVVAFSPRGRYLLTGSENGSAVLWDVQTGVSVRVFAGLPGSTASVAFSPDGRFFLTGSAESSAGLSPGQAVLWDGQTGAKVRAFVGHTGGVNSAVFSPDGRFILTGGQDGTAKLWDARTGVEIRTFTGHRGSILAASFSSDGRFVITGSRDGSARIWEPGADAEPRVISGKDSSSVSSAVFSPDGRRILLGRDSGAFETWDARSLKNIFSSAGGAGFPEPAVLSPDGRTVLTGHSYATAKLWDAQTGQWIRDLRSPLIDGPDRYNKSMDKGIGPDWRETPEKTVPPEAPEDVIVTRYPTMETQSRVAVGLEFTVQVSLTTEQITPDVSVRQGAMTAGGALELGLPDRKGWTIDVALSAEGFSFRGGDTAKITLPNQGDSTPARFYLTPGPTTAAQEDRRLFATLWHEGRYLAKIQRTIAVVRSPGEGAAAPLAAIPPTPAPGPADRGAMTIASTDATDAPDLTVYVRIAPNPVSPQISEILLVSRDLQIMRHDFPTPSGLAKWLAGYYQNISAAGRGVIVPGGRPGPAASPALQKDKNVALLQGLGQELYQKFAPDAFKQAFWALHDKLGIEFDSIQVFTNDPTLPWELMRPVRPDGSDPQDFLGVGFRVARWHVSQGTLPVDSPPKEIPLETLTVIAPDYQGESKLPAVAAEIAALQEIAGFQPVAGQFAELKKLFASGRGKPGIIHYAGHGIVRDLATGGKDYAIKLEDGELDVMTWRGLTARLQGLKDRAYPFFVFNACDIGQADLVANFVDGWAPAVLENGASGFIGGLWPLGDAGAAAFATRFYELVEARLAQKSASVAQILQQTRQLFYETGDPTFLAYVYYGYPEFRFLPPVSPKVP